MDQIASPALDWIQVEVTTHCNGSCVYCPHTIMSNHWSSKHMPLELFSELNKVFSKLLFRPVKIKEAYLEVNRHFGNEERTVATFSLRNVFIRELNGAAKILGEEFVNILADIALKNITSRMNGGANNVHNGQQLAFI